MLHRKRNKVEFYLRIRALAREMRKNQTPAEEIFWEKVRDRRLFGLKWNRQYVLICPRENNYEKFYIPDFHCHKLKLIVELDGQIHLKQITEDHLRTEEISRTGYAVIRFSNEKVLNQWDEVAKTILEFMEKQKNNS